MQNMQHLLSFPPKIFCVYNKAITALKRVR
jgi:hypothetical protein